MFEIALTECQAFVESLKDVPAELHNDLIDSFVLYLQCEYPDVMEIDYLAEIDITEAPLYVTDVNVDLLDITGLEAKQAQTLALLLTRWNKAGKAYTWRQGKRYLNGSIRTLQVNHPFIQDLGISDILPHIPQTSYWYGA